MRATHDWDAKLGSHQENSQDLVHTSKTAGVDLADVDGVGLKKLLEDHAIVGVLSGSCHRRSA